MRNVVLIIGIIALAGCTVVEVKSVDRAVYSLDKVCIEQNDAVKPAGFLPMIENSFAEHGIVTERYHGRPSGACEYTATYVAHWNWDIAVYLTDAEVVIRRGGEEVGHAVYHLRNKGGLDMGKWSSAESKMQPVMDRLLVNFIGKQIINPRPATVTQDDFEKAKKCQGKGGVWVNNQCVVQVE